MGQEPEIFIERPSSYAGLVDALDRERALAKIRRPLGRMNEVVDWEMFRPVLEEQLENGKLAGPARPTKDPVLMLKMCVLQDLHGLSDEVAEFQVLNRTSFWRILGLSVSDKGPIHLCEGQSQVRVWYSTSKSFAAHPHQ